jgi:subtilase family serine protease
MPENQPGRNVPDLSLNADPYTGYLLYFGGQWSSGWGGTSFVAPQLNGIAALLGQAAGSRLGLINPALYRLARNNGYNQKGPFNDITSADNLGFQAGPGYDPASGIGSINAANLARALSQDGGEPDSD